MGAQLFLENLGLGYLAASVRKHCGATHRALIWDCPIRGRSREPAALPFPELVFADSPQ
jgi:hypothetical protein